MAASITRRDFVASSLAAGVSAALAGSALGCAPRRADYDVVVVGAGVIGCCTARELARYELSVLVLEAGLDIACGASRANSGIVHAGFDPKPGTLKAKYNVAGAALFPEWQADLGFNYQQNGALVLAFDDDDLETLDELQARGEENGASETRVIGRDELRELEPNVSAEAVGALHAPGSGIVDPYGLAFAAAENAADNGVDFLFGRRVSSVARDGGLLRVGTEDGTEVRARAVVNAAGVFSDEVNNMVCSERLSILVRRGEYQLYNNRLHPFERTMFQTPTDKGKGVLVTHAAFGNLIVGPNSVDQDSRTSVATTSEGLDEIVAAAARTWPDLTNDDVISNFAGLRAVNADTHDFVVGESSEVSGFFNAACIDSPGLASAPAIGQDVARMVAESLDARESDSFDPKRQSMPPFAFAGEEAQQEMLAADPAYATTVCRCCQVREAEITNVLNGVLGVFSLDAIKWRTGAMMGPCQSGRCLTRILGLMARELGLDVSEIEKREADSNVVAGAVADSADDGGVVAAAGQVEFDEAVIELPRAAYRIPGTRPAGVLSARSAIELLAQGELPGEHALVWGSTDLAEQAVVLMGQAGMEVERLADEDEITWVEGGSRLESVTVAGADGERTIECDTLVISHDYGVAEG